MLVLNLLLCVFKLIQLVEMKKRKDLNEKTYVRGLYASLKEKNLLLSISQDPSSAQKQISANAHSSWKNTKEKKEKGFLDREVKHATPSGYWLGSLVVEQCVCSYVTLLGYCQGLLVVEQHQRWKLILWNFQLTGQTTLPDFETLWSSWNFCCVWLTWQIVNRVYPWSKWANQSNPHNNSILPERPRPCSINEPKQRSWSFTNVSPSVVATATPPKFWPASNFRASLESFTWCLHTFGFTLWARVSLFTHLAWSFNGQILYVGINVSLTTMFWSCTRSSLCVYVLCSLGKHPSHSHTKSYALSC